MKPVIGIAPGFEENALKLRIDYVSAVEQSGAIPLILPIVNDSKAVAERIDGLLLTGGGDIPPGYFGEQEQIYPEGRNPENARMESKERIDFETKLLKEILAVGKPVLAICYGMQLLNVLHGGTLFQDISYQVHDSLDHRKGMHEINITDNLNGVLQNHYMINSSHHQSVKKTGTGLSVFGTAPDNVIEGIYKTDYNFCVGVQWHPERIFYDPLSVWLFRSLVDKAAAYK